MGGTVMDPKKLQAYVSAIESGHDMEFDSPEEAKAVAAALNARRAVHTQPASVDLTSHATAQPEGPTQGGSAQAFMLGAKPELLDYLGPALSSGPLASAAERMSQGEKAALPGQMTGLTDEQRAS